MIEWNLKARSHSCNKCTRGFKDGERCHSVVAVFENPLVQTLLADKIAASSEEQKKRRASDYVRLDFCPDCWDDVPAAGWISLWHSAYTAPEPPPPEALPRETAESLLRKLMEKTDNEEYVSVIFILAVMLERRKILFERQVQQSPDGTLVRIYEHKKTGEVMLITDPDLSADEIPGVQQLIETLLNPPEPDPGKEQEESPNADKEPAAITVKNDFDVIFEGGVLVDGSGDPSWKADIGVRGEEITEIGDLKKASAETRLDCSDMCVAPGFIDVHSHSDTYILLRPDAPSKIRQGVTTEIVGQCGSSASPLMGDARLPSDWAAHTYPGQWQNASEYKALLAEADPLMNIIFLTGHRNLRMSVMGMDTRPATKDEVNDMVRLLASELENGSSGFSTGLIYQPSRSAPVEEIHALASECARQGGHYATHMRNEKNYLLEAIDEALKTAEISGVPLQISHFKTAGQQNWHLADEAIARIESAREKGMHVFADRYPYTASGTDLDIILPDRATRGGNDESLKRLADSSTRKAIAEEMMKMHLPEYWRTVMVGATWSPENADFSGRYIQEIADEAGITPAEAVLQIVEKDKMRTVAFFFGMSDENLRRILSLPWVMVASDASLRSFEGVLSDDHPHPRAFGTFPRFLQMCRDENLMTMEEAVRRITSLPAEAFGIKGRGLLRKGFVADIVAFDYAEVKDNATYSKPRTMPGGIKHVMCRGKPAF
jgi:N-acyl-D-amino-acid deacylase